MPDVVFSSAIRSFKVFKQLYKVYRIYTYIVQVSLDFFLFYFIEDIQVCKPNDEIALFSSEESSFECLGFHDCHVPAHRPAVSNLSVEICKAENGGGKTPGTIKRK